MTFGDPGLAGKPSAIIQGKCDYGQCTSFQMEVVDGDDSAPVVGDFVCNVNVSGFGKMNTPTSDSEPAAQLIRGDVEVRPSGN